MYPLRTRAFGAVLIVTVLALGVVPTTPTRSAPIPPSAVNEKDEPFEYDVGGVTKKATRRVRTVALGDRIMMTFVRIKAGTFTMGSPKDEKNRSPDENQHDVTLTRDYYLGLYAVTRRQFRAFVDDTKYKTEADDKGGLGWDARTKDWKWDPKYTWQNTGFDQSDEHPVVNVIWNDAVAFCAWLSKKAGKTCRLPSEAEWEYACRAGTTTRFSFGDDEEELWKYANVMDKEFRTATGEVWGIKGSDGYAFTAPVGKFRPNAWGLHDMHGNVWQWCDDYYGPYNKLDGGNDPVQSTKQADKSLHVLRGGSFRGSPLLSRAAARGSSFSPPGRNNSVGFRVCFRLD